MCLSLCLSLSLVTVCHTPGDSRVSLRWALPPDAPPPPPPATTLLMVGGVLRTATWFRRLRITPPQRGQKALFISLPTPGPPPTTSLQRLSQTGGPTARAAHRWHSLPHPILKRNKHRNFSINQLLLKHVT